MNELDEIRANFETLNPIPEGLIYYPKGDYYAIESDEDGWWSEHGQSIISAYQGRYCGFKMGLAHAPVVPDIDRIKLLQYESLRGHFSKMIDNVLGKDYYNMGHDVYQCDELTCEDITIKANLSWREKLMLKESS